jgi:Rho-binding antiterminator
MTEPLNQNPYAPIACARYSEYEEAIMHRQKLHLRWHEDNVHYDQVVLPLDLKTVNHEEFLIFRADSDKILTIRLDRIRRMELA